MATGPPRGGGRTGFERVSASTPLSGTTHAEDSRLPQAPRPRDQGLHRALRDEAHPPHPRPRPAPLVDKRNYLMRGDALNLDEGSIDFDVVTKLVLADRDAYAAWATAVFRPGAAEQVADKERFLNRARLRAFVVEEFVTTE